MEMYQIATFMEMYKTFTNMIQFILQDYKDSSEAELSNALKQAVANTFRVSPEIVTDDFNPYDYIDCIIPEQEMVNYTLSLIITKYFGDSELITGKVKQFLSMCSGIPEERIDVKFDPVGALNSNPSLRNKIMKAMENFDVNSPPIPSSGEKVGVPDNVEELAKEKGISVDHYIMEWL